MLAKCLIRWSVRGALAIAAVLGCAAALPSVAGATTNSLTFTATGAEQSFTVPPGVTSLQVALAGAAGGHGLNGFGGPGALVTGTLAVTPGQTLYVEVCGWPALTAAGGFNGGGTLGLGGTGAGAGGGASDLGTCASATCPLASLDTRLVVAAGGGGAGGRGLSGSALGGVGGSWEGAGADGTGTSAGHGGGAGTPTAGGLGGTSTCFSSPQPAGLVGHRGGGGDGGVCTLSSTGDGGGGGGGYYGGGGGGAGASQGAGGGGGGGSNLLPADGVASSSDSLSGQVVLSWDTTAPTTSIALDPDSPNGQSGWYTSPLGVTVSASDGGDGSTIAQTRCVLDRGSVPTSFDDLPAEPCSLTGVDSDGSHTIYAASESTAGDG